MFGPFMRAKPFARVRPCVARSGPRPTTCHVGSNHLLLFTVGDRIDGPQESPPGGNQFGDEGGNVQKDETRGMLPIRGVLLAGCLAVAAVLSAASARGQQTAPGQRIIRHGVIGGAPDGRAVAESDIFKPADRATLKRLEQSQKLVAEGRYAEAARGIGAILESPQDFFYPPTSLTPHSLRAQAQQMIGQMPREGREAYELEYGALPRQALDKAVEAGDAALLGDVSRRFFHTQAGYQATYLLGLHQFDHDHPLAGAGIGPLARRGCGGRAIRALLVADAGGLLASVGHARPGRAGAGEGPLAAGRAATGRPAGGNGRRPRGSAVRQRCGGGRLAGGRDRARAPGGGRAPWTAG